MKSISLFVTSLLILFLSGCNNEKDYNKAISIDELRANSKYVGREACMDCHEKEYNLHIGSHHDLAMDHVNDSTVLGNFNNTYFNHLGVKSKFFKRDGKFFVNTEGINGKFDDFEIKYVFGVYPLQQYLIDFGAGSFQTLPLCWDSRKKEDGGQRWFHIYDQEKIKHNDLLYWTNSFQNWNYMCAECHSTNLIKGYDVIKKEYNTTWEEIDVSCEACHGPGSEHVRWGKAEKKGVKLNVGGDLGVINSMKNNDQGAWIFKNENDSIATRTVGRKDNKLVETCARCHARRGLISEDYKHGGEFLDTHFPVLLNDAHYYPDGQIKDEDYVYGSFLQSKMYKAGVVCTDCHDAHSYKVIANDNRLCAQCHKPDMYDTPEHHFHKINDTGASCIKCHMPTTNYMVVDPRLDHSMRIPRPDLSIKIGSPNSCNQCHTDKTNEWSLEATDKWYGDLSKGEKHFGEIFYEANKGNPKVQYDLISLATNKSQPEIVRATAIEYFTSYPNSFSLDALQELISDSSSLLKYIATSSIQYIGTENDFNLLKDLLANPVRLVRIEAVKALIGLDTTKLNDKYKNSYKSALMEYRSSQLVNSDNYASHLNLGILETQLGNYEKAEKEYKIAIEMEPLFLRTYVNLADLYKNINRESDGENILHEALKFNKYDADVNYSLGLFFIRKNEYSTALKHLKIASESEMHTPRYIYVYAVGLNSVGKKKKAINILEKATTSFPYDQDIRNTIISLSLETNNFITAKKHTETLVEYYPQNRDYRDLLIKLNGVIASE